MCAGQGSQYYMMGRDFYEKKGAFRDWMDYGARLLEAHLGGSLVDLLYRPRTDRFAPFDRTRDTHPAVFCVNYSVARTLMDEGIRPSRVLGYSLGELVAWTLAGAVRFEEALACVAEMAAKIEELTPPAAMLAILGPPEIFESRPDLFRGTWVACINYAENFVIAGSREDVARVQQALQPADFPCQLLPVTRGFHSPLVNPIEFDLKHAVARLSPRAPRLPVVSCLRACELAPQDLTPEYCWELLRLPVRFPDTVRFMEEQEPSIYVDVGPSGTLASFVRNLIGREGASGAFPILTQFRRDLKNLERLREALAS
jgi:acyl transferase domain-containing protein